MAGRPKHILKGAVEAVVHPLAELGDKYRTQAVKSALKVQKRLEEIALNPDSATAQVAAIKEINNRAFGQSGASLQIDQTVHHIVSYADRLRELNQIIQDQAVIDTTAVEVIKEPVAGPNHL